MKTLLITAFDAFGGEDINPSCEAMNEMKDEIEGICIRKLLLPTEFEKGRNMILSAIEDINPDYVLSIGQAGGRNNITVEKIAINYQNAKIPDNDGFMPYDRKIIEDGPDGLFSTLPIENIIAAIKLENIPVEISYSAGAYVCNTVMYSALYLAKIKYKHMKCGFIHIPYIPKQVIEKNSPSMELSTIVKALEIAAKEIGND